MRHVEIRGCLAAVAVWGVSLCGLGIEPSAGAEVSGTVRMPEVCSPAVSPAVVYLTPAQANGKRLSLMPARAQEPPGQSRRADLVLVNQRGLQFIPRVQAI